MARKDGGKLTYQLDSTGKYCEYVTDQILSTMYNVEHLTLLVHPLISEAMVRNPVHVLLQKSRHADVAGCFFGHLRIDSPDSPVGCWIEVSPTEERL